MSGNKNYTIEYLETVVEDDIPALPASIKPMIKKAIEERLMTDPISYGKPFRYSLKGHRRLRVADFRIIYRIDPDHHTVIIVAIKNRKDIYKN